jgi:Amt family ammonium transporter
VAVAAWAVVGTVIIIWIVRAITPLRVSDDDETEGLDVTIHGERGYNF